MKASVQDQISQALGTQIRNVSAVSGGDISKAYLLRTSADLLFCKFHHGPEAYNMFLSEEAGLNAIAATRTIRTPEVVRCLSLEQGALLLLEYIEAKRPSPKNMQTLGEELGALHRITKSNFGWEISNYIGYLPQQNDWSKDWAYFYVQSRLLPQLNMAQAAGLLAAGEMPREERMSQVLKSVCGDITPSLLHGDLWGGNFLISTDDRCFLIDPAVYHGHFEVDLAMSRLFGGFSNEFYKAHQSHFSETTGAAARQDLYQLYYLLVHLNLFGSSYRASVVRILKRYF